MKIKLSNGTMWNCDGFGGDWLEAFNSGKFRGEKRIVVGPVRFDNYRFFGYRSPDGQVYVKAGCRNFSLKAARRHWRPENRVKNLQCREHVRRRKNIESLAICAYIEGVFKSRYAK